MTKEERHAILTPAEIADARAQADRAIRTVGIPPELIAQLRPILAPAAERLAAEQAECERVEQGRGMMTREHLTEPSRTDRAQANDA
ncbi:hypothetical protein DMH25_00220 [Streptomyces sp. WAC 01325]|uniref:hypothetical protein n=1 Tax=Streptomyces sp. WAC 01325 TaxID=2203202 RepID=UPI000F881346|nr:hypothetical protein [Streptomyces sp. WAC 01325]RSN18726.1 hypothetical protein DMH25_00220 [Streptomyces sp. WAC 01325]